MKHNDIGVEGERIALEYLQEKGYFILACNYRFLKAEVDIIAQYKEELIVVEVKTRTSNFLPPEDSVNKRKMRLIIKATDHFIIERDLDIEARFDIISILISPSETTINHITDAYNTLDV